MKSLRESLYLFLEKYPPSLRLFQRLERTGEIYLIGGVLREFKDNGSILDLRDIDIIIDVKNKEEWESILGEFQTDQNRFGGRKLNCSGVIVDIWPLNETWAYRNKIIECNPEGYVNRLTDTVFLNMDAIVYDLKRNVWYEKKYQEAMQSGILDVVLESNPQVPLNIVRAMVLKKRYTMVYSPRLRRVIKGEMQREKSFVDRLMEIQRKRYHREILPRETIEAELEQL